IGRNEIGNIIGKMFDSGLVPTEDGALQVRELIKCTGNRAYVFFQPNIGKIDVATVVMEQCVAVPGRVVRDLVPGARPRGLGFRVPPCPVVGTVSPDVMQNAIGVGPKIWRAVPTGREPAAIYEQLAIGGSIDAQALRRDGPAHTQVVPDGNGAAAV